MGTGTRLRRISSQFVPVLDAREGHWFLSALLLSTRYHLLSSSSLNRFCRNMPATDYALAVVPMLLPAWYLLNLLDDNPLPVIGRWIEQFSRALTGKEAVTTEPLVPPVGSQLLAYVAVAIFGFLLTNHLIPNIQVRSAREGREVNLSHLTTLLLL